MFFVELRFIYDLIFNKFQEIIDWLEGFKKLVKEISGKHIFFFIDPEIEVLEILKLFQYLIQIYSLNFLLKFYRFYPFNQIGIYGILYSFEYILHLSLDIFGLNFIQVNDDILFQIKQEIFKLSIKMLVFQEALNLIQK